MNETADRSISEKTVFLRHWSGWAPGLQQREQWLSWLAGDPAVYQDRGEKPACAEIKPLLRRRCSYITRMVLETGFAVCREAEIDPATVNTVYGSRNGEIQTLRKLFDSLSAEEPLSPTFFSNSVHHTPTGYLSMSTKNTLISRTISAGRDSFICACLESLNLLRRFPETPVLLLIADETLPVPFDQLLDPPPFAYAVGLLLEAEGPGRRLVLERSEQEPSEERRQEEQVLEFLKWLEQGQGALHMNTSFGVWTWS